MAAPLFDPMTTFVYLDQKDYGGLVDAQNAGMRSQLRAWVQGGDVVVPLSMIHFVETSKAEPGLRARLFEVMLELSRGAVIRGIPQLVALEDRAVGSRDRVRDGLLSMSFFDMFGASAPPMELSLAAYLAATSAVTPSAQIHDVVERSWDTAAAGINAERDRFPSLAEAYGRAFQREVSPHDLPSLRTTFPHFAVMHAIQAAIVAKVPAGLTGHDIGDSVALGVVLPYFDVVGLDKRMLARVRDAERAIADIRRARVERKLPDLIDAVRSAIAAEKAA